MILDNDRTIKLSQMYTDESVNTFKKSIESTLNDAVYKVTKLEMVVDEEIEKLK
jgi:hypothetical protein